MKSVHYICQSNEMGKVVCKAMEYFTAVGFVGAEDEQKKLRKETHVYYDNYNHSTFSRSLMFYGGFLRQVISKDSDEVFVDYKHDVCAKTTRFKVDRPVSVVEISNAVKFRGRLVFVFEVDCNTFTYLMASPNGIVIELSMQEVKMKNGEQVGFITLRDKTRLKHGKAVEERLEEEINKLFKNYKAIIDDFALTQVHHKYQTLLTMQNEKLNNKEPF